MSKKTHLLPKSILFAISNLTCFNWSWRNKLKKKKKITIFNISSDLYHLFTRFLSIISSNSIVFRCLFETCSNPLYPRKGNPPIHLIELLFPFGMQFMKPHPAIIYLFKVKNRNNIEKDVEYVQSYVEYVEYVQSQWPRSGVFIVNFDHILPLLLVFLLLTLSLYLFAGYHGLRLVFSENKFQPFSLLSFQFTRSIPACLEKQLPNLKWILKK